MERNDPRQYDELAGAWWQESGPFAALHWLAATRGALIPPAPRPGALLVDVACGGGLMAAHAAGYAHLGVDITRSALEVARGHGVVPVRGDARRLPVASGAADVVVAGEVFEHVEDVASVVAEIARVLRPGGCVVFDTINDTRWARLSMVTVGERLPGGPPPRIHDPALFVAPSTLRQLFGRHGVRIEVWGLRPSVRDYARFLARRRRPVRMVPTRSLGAVYQGIGVKEQQPEAVG